MAISYSSICLSFEVHSKKSKQYPDDAQIYIHRQCKKSDNCQVTLVSSGTGVKKTCIVECCFSSTLKTCQQFVPQELWNEVKCPYIVITKGHISLLTKDFEEFWFCSASDVPKISCFCCTIDVKLIKVNNPDVSTLGIQILSVMILRKSE